MNKNELIAELASRFDTTKDQAGKNLDSFIEVIVESLKKGEDVKILGFGNFVVTRRAAKMGRNPQTGAPVEIKAANVPKFKAGKALKEALN